MDSLLLYQILGKGSWLAFMFAYGACVGSLINVLVYRLPRGLPVAVPASRCPACETRLTWRENIPVLGWIFLHGRCRFCKSRISPEYPLVEAFCGLAFVLLFALWYLVPMGWTWLGVDWSLIRPEWAATDVFDGWPRTSWGPFVVLLVLVGCLTAMTIVDAKTFTIPLQLPWAATAAGIVLHTLHALGVGTFGWPTFMTAPQTLWAIPTPGGGGGGGGAGWWWIGASIGAVVGLALSMLFLRLGWLRRSFDDYQAWEDGVRREAGLPPLDHAEEPQHLVRADEDPGFEARGVFYFALVWIALALGLGLIGPLAGPALGLPAWFGLALGGVGGPFVAAAMLNVRTRRYRPPAPDAKADAAPPDMWVQYPHARREMVKELLFLTPAIGLGWLAGSVLAGRAEALGQPPLWLTVLAGTLMGYLIGGGIVWAVRILGSLAFGKEAMGLGDVHLMGAVGACLGWIDAAIAFPLAAVVGLYWLVVGRIAGGGAARAMPFGPSLALATVLVVLGKPLVEQWLTHLLAIPPGEPGINLP